MLSNIPRNSNIFLILDFDFSSKSHGEGRRPGAQIQNSIDVEQLKHA